MRWGWSTGQDMGRRISLVLGIAALLAAPLPAARAWSLFPPTPAVGKPAPDFNAAMLDGRKITLADYRGRVLVINFWATWCGPCKRELPLLDAYYKAQRKYGLEVIAVTTENSLPLTQLQPLAKALAIPMVRYMHGGYGALEGVPTNFVIDRAGMVRYAKAGAFDLAELNDLLVPLLREPTPPTVPPTATAALAPAAAARPAVVPSAVASSAP